MKKVSSYAIIIKVNFMQRYFIKNEQVHHNKIVIANDDVHHIKNVMRMQVGDEVICCDESQVYLAKIESISNIVNLTIEKLLDYDNELKIQVTIAQGLVRREKTEEVIRRLTELGCYAYLPVTMRRSIVKANPDKLERWYKIIKEASEQSQRNKLMMLKEPLAFNDFLKLAPQYDLCLYAHVSEDNNSFNKIINQFNGQKILVLVGPEGGYDDTEIQTLETNGFKRISLGKRILRTETAPLYIMSVLGYEFGDKK
jgi:16S rRNA (uracil1498-N3)-methyltransferase